MKKLLLFVFTVLFGMAANTVNAKIRIYENVEVSKFPQSLQNNLQHHEWKKGFLDVTKPPYNAKGDGITDDTEAIQSAIDDAFACNFVVYFPKRTYLVSEQLSCIQPAGPNLPNNPISAKGQRKFGHILLGSEINGEWPTIKLKDNSWVKENLLILFQYVGTDGNPDASRHYLGSIRNFNIDMGNNPGVSSLSNDGAQHCVIENISIFGNFNIGIKALPGSGGYSANISIIGGRIGIKQSNYRPNPTVFGVRLENQSENAIIITESRGAVTFSGFEIVGPSSGNTSYKAIDLYNDKSGSRELKARANLNLVDGSIETFNDNAAINSFKQDIVIKDVYFKCKTITKAGTYSTNPKILSSDPSKWKLLKEYVYSTNEGNGSVYIDGVNKRIPNEDYNSFTDLVDQNLAGDLLTRHVWGNMPSWEGNILDITEYGATRDDNSDDDAIAIQAAIDAIVDENSEDYNKTLFIPRGCFHIKSPIVIRKGVKMIGAGKNISLIMVDESWLPSSHLAAVTTEDVPSSDIILSDFGLVYCEATGNVTAHKNFTLLELKSGDITLRDVQIDRYFTKWEDGKEYGKYEYPVVSFDGNISGKFYGISLGFPSRGATDENYRVLSVKNSTGKVNFYQLSVENASSVQLGESRVQMEVNNCHQVTIWGLKYEKYGEYLHVNNTSIFKIFGASGNFSLCNPDNTSILKFENTPSLFIANVSRQPQDCEVSGKYFVYDDGKLVTDNAPVSLYKKGNFLSSSSYDYRNH